MTSTERDAGRFFIHGQELAAAGRMAEAARAFGQAIAVNPRFVPALFALAQIQRMHGDFRSAEANLSGALALSEHDPPARDIVAAALADVLGSLEIDQYDARRDDALRLCLD